MNIFEFASREKRLANTPIFINGRRFRQPELNWNFYYQFIMNPLMPEKIINQLKNFKIGIKVPYLRNNIQSEENIFFILKGSKQFDFDNNVMLKFGANKDGTFFDLNDFRENIIALKMAIIGWLNKYGIKDVNLIDK